MEISRNSYTFDFFEGNEIPKAPEEIPLEAWFSESFSFEPNKFIFEQCFPLTGLNAVLVVLWEK